MHVVFTSFYTESTSYEQAAENLCRSLRRFELTYDIRPRPDSGSWQFNTHQKLHHLLDVFKDYPQDAVVWIDSDGEVVRLPSLMLDGSLEAYTFAAHLMRHDRGRVHGQQTELLAGTMWFNPSHLRQLFVEEVLDRISVAPNRLYGEQLYIQEINQEWHESAIQPSWHFHELPVEYTAVYDRHIRDPVIVHYQASRDLRRDIHDIHARNRWLHRVDQARKVVQRG